MMVIVGEDFRHPHKLVSAADLHPQQIVLADGEAFIEATRRPDRIGLGEGGMDRPGATGQKVRQFPFPFVIRGNVRPSPASSKPQILPAAIGQYRFPVSGQRGHQFLEAGACPFIVGVEKRDVAAPRLPEPEIAGRADAAVVLVEHPDPWVVEAGEAGGRVIGRTIVDDDQLEVAVGLRQDAGNAPLDQPSAVVARHDHGNQVRIRVHVPRVGRLRVRSAYRLGNPLKLNIISAAFRQIYRFPSNGKTLLRHVTCCMTVLRT
ncbi:protein of unknown function [Candidatus Methylocalor cossyra]|uniref:Uncharacterized protein n=1 Tax=Candidatus Methylocalor cossyra TaxID=3108543 RepID=A0ABM9NHL6_9GAMM